MKLSVVIPVYDTEETLEACVKSVLDQGVDDTEIILVDDGSDDGSPAMCDRLAREHEEVCTIHEEHRGIAGARNKGIEKARGEYIMFVDSDDSLAPYTLPILLARIGAHPDYDILEYPIIWHAGEDDEEVLKFGRHEYGNMKEYWVEGKGYAHAYACNKIYRRRLFDKVRYPMNRAFIDAYTLPRLLEQCRLVATTEEGAYQYNYSPDGMATMADGEDLEQLLEVHVDMLEHYGLTEEPSEYYVYALQLQLDVYAQTKEPPILPELIALSGSSIRRLPISRKDKRRLRFIKHFSIKGLCKLYRLRHRQRHR